MELQLTGGAGSHSLGSGGCGSGSSGLGGRGGGGSHLGVLRGKVLAQGDDNGHQQDQAKEHNRVAQQSVHTGLADSNIRSKHHSKVPPYASVMV